MESAISIAPPSHSNAAQPERQLDTYSNAIWLNTLCSKRAWWPDGAPMLGWWPDGTPAKHAAIRDPNGSTHRMMARWGTSSLLGYVNQIGIHTAWWPDGTPKPAWWPDGAPIPKCMRYTPQIINSTIMLKMSKYYYLMCPRWGHSQSGGHQGHT